MSANNICPVCDSALASDAAPARDCDEAVCAACAASYTTLMAEITENAPRPAVAPVETGMIRANDAGTEAVLVADANVFLAPSMPEAEEVWTAQAEAAARKASEDLLVFEEFDPAEPVNGVAEEGERGYAVGVSLHRVPSGALVLVSACLFCALMLAGWHGMGERGEGSVVAGEKQPLVVAEEALWQPSEPASKSRSEAEPEPESEPEAAQNAADMHPEADEAHEPLAVSEMTPAEAEEAEAREAAEAEEAAATVAPAPSVATAHAADGGKFTIQVGSYNLAPEADDRAAALRKAGYDARVSSAVLPGKGTWYRVHSGRFGARDEALRYERQLKASGVVASTFVAEIKN